MAAPYPLVFRPLLMPKVWGGRRLEKYGKALPPGVMIGESWEVADLPETSASGAGGGAARSVIAEGALAGRTLHEAMAEWGEGMLGGVKADRGCFPLLVKYLDARENLSVQVHPGPAYAATHPGAAVKHECWYVLEAGGVIYKGVRPGVTRAALEKAVAAGEAPGVLEAVPAVPGECHTLPSGTVHALGAGALVAEVQTPSDTTFRLYDWGRTGRALHVPEALECAECGPAPAARRASGPRSRVATTGTFTVDALWGAAPFRSQGRCAVLMVLAGGMVLTWGGGRMPLRAGTTVLIPAAVACEGEPDAAFRGLLAELVG